MTKKNNTKKLTPTELKKQVRKLDEQREVLIFIGDTDYSVTFDLHFKKSKQLTLMEDLVKFFNEGSQRVEILDMATPYTAMLILKHFTSIEVSDDISEALLLLETLIDLEILHRILEELPEDEITKIYELIAETTVKFRETLEQMQEEVKEASKQVENNEVKTKLQEMIANEEGNSTETTVE